MTNSRSFVKSGFCHEEVKRMDELVSGGFAKSRADIVRKATIEYISRYGVNE